MDEARQRGILTIGFGDGGNEMGMGSILSAIEKYSPNGNIHGSHTKADIVVVASSATWGTYGVGMSEGWLDGVPPEVCCSIVHVLNYLVDVRMRPWALNLGGS